MLAFRTAGACAVAISAAVSLVPSAASAAPTANASAKPTITMSGSTTVAPLAQKLIRSYLKTYPGSTAFKLAQGGSDIGVADAAAGRVSIGMSSRDAKASDPGGIVFHKIARDALCLATNSANKVGNLSAEQVQAIFSGRVRDWSQVPGATVQGTINLNVRTPASGTQDAFQKLFLGNARIANTAAQKASNGLVTAAVKSDPNAIGYVSLAFTDGLNAPSFQGVSCDLRTAKSGQYPGARNLWFVTRGAPTGATQKFIRWTQQSRLAAKNVATEWVPLR